MGEQGLSRKLAEWAGFKKLPAQVEAYSYIIIFPDGVRRNIGELPDFTQSLDASFKWLGLKIIDKIMAEQGCSSDVAYAILFKKWLGELELIIPDASLAFCLAIEKLINGGG